MVWDAASQVCTSLDWHVRIGGAQGLLGGAQGLLRGAQGLLRGAQGLLRGAF